jgi:predicted Zn-dependent peptidase
MKFKKTTLPNGLNILTVPMKETQTVAVVVMVGVGARYETDKEDGISHFIEHMMFKGTQKRPTYLEISEELDSIGGVSNAFTSEDVTAFYVKADARHFEKALDVIADVFLNSKIDEKAIEKEKGPIIQEINMIKDNPQRHVHDVFARLLYAGSPLARNVVGLKETVASFKRDDIVQYQKKFYVATNTTVCVAGKIDEIKTIKKLKNYFSGMRIAKKPVAKKVIENQKKPGVKINFKKTDQTHLLLGNRTYHQNHKDRFVLSVLSVILGGNMSSRLFIEVREKKGLAYYVRTFVDAFSDCGYIATQAGVEHKNLEATIRTVAAEYKKIATEKVSKEELQRAKDYIKGISVMGLEASDEVAMFFVDQPLKKKEILTPSEIFARIDKVTQNDILRVAKDIFKTKTLNLAVIGPHKNEKNLQKLLKI